jgi:hypothetical protein
MAILLFIRKSDDTLASIELPIEATQADLYVEIRSLGINDPLVFQGEILKDDTTTLADAGICPETTLSVQLDIINFYKEDERDMYVALNITKATITYYYEKDKPFSEQFKVVNSTTLKLDNIEGIGRRGERDESTILIHNDYMEYYHLLINDFQNDMRATRYTKINACDMPCV